MGYHKSNIIFENLPFYKEKKSISNEDELVIQNIISEYAPEHVFICGDSDPNGTHKKCFDILQKKAIKNVKNYWIYKGAWGIWDNKNDEENTSHTFN